MRRSGGLSGGEQQRLRVAQALLGDPALLLCDEPLLSLDLNHQQGVVELIDARRRAADTAVVFVTHEINPILPFVDRILYLAGGRWAAGPVDEVMTSERLSDLYGVPVDVLRVRGRIVVVGGGRFRWPRPRRRPITCTITTTTEPTSREGLGLPAAGVRPARADRRHPDRDHQRADRPVRGVARHGLRRARQRRARLHRRRRRPAGRRRRGRRRAGRLARRRHRDRVARQPGQRAQRRDRGRPRVRARPRRAAAELLPRLRLRGDEHPVRPDPRREQPRHRRAGRHRGGRDRRARVHLPAAAVRLDRSRGGARARGADPRWSAWCSSTSWPSP